MKTREEYVLKANIKYFVGYVAVLLSVLTAVTVILCDPMFWSLLGITSIVLYVKFKFF
jgi:hypothetical protein